MRLEPWLPLYKFEAQHSSTRDVSHVGRSKLSTKGSVPAFLLQEFPTFVSRVSLFRVSSSCGIESTQKSYTG